MNSIGLLLDYSFQALVKNWRAFLLYMLFFVVLTLLSLVHFVSILANFLFQLIATQIMVYYGTPVLKGFSKQELYSFLETSTLKKVFTERFEVSAGIFLSSFLTNLMITLLIVAVVFAFGVPLIRELEVTHSWETTDFILKFFLLFLVALSILSWYLYLYPLALGYAMGKEGFGEAFLGFLKIFSPSLWKRALSFKYFLFITVSGILGSIFLLVGVVTIFFLPLGAAFLYFSNVFFGGAAAECYLIAFKDESKDESQSQS